MKAGKCQICKIEIDLEGLQEGETLPYDFSLSRFHTCSNPCTFKAIQCNGAWRLKENIRRLTAIDFGTFQTVFGFNEAGDYAKNMHDLARQSPMRFMFKIDEDNFIKLVNGRM